MKKIFILLLLVTQLSSYEIHSKTTLNILEFKASKILTDFQGETRSQFNQLNNSDKALQYRYSREQYSREQYRYSREAYIVLLEESTREYLLVQIGPNSFKVVQ
jgi:glycosylphosphatidylinositol transamidase (GPIT) subunit GPI8